MDQNPQAIKLDSNESLNLDGTILSWSSNSSKVESLKKMVKFVVSVCVLSLFLAIFSQFPHSFTFNHGMERKYMFLICNGILFLLATCSVIEDSSFNFSSFEPCDYSFSHSDHDHDDHHQFEPLVAAIEEQNQEMETKEEIEEIINGAQLEEGEDEDKDENKDEDEDEDEDEGYFTDEIEEDDEEGKWRGLEMVVSTEELNKKIEEFIRKMKEEMRIEAAQTQLIAV